MLEFQNVSLHNKKKKILDNFNLKLSEGVIFGLVGSDERAKSAILEAAAGCQPPARGKIQLDGTSVYHSTETYLKIGYMPRDFLFYDQLKVHEYYEMFLALYKVNGRYQKRRMEEVFNLLELESYENRFLGEIPEETKAFLSLGKAILHEPSWLFMDDPFYDLGPVQRKKMIDILSMLWEQGTSLVINTNIFPEITSFLTDIAVIEDGQMISTGTIESVYEEALRSSPIHLRVLEGMDNALRVLRENDLVERVVVNQEDIILVFSGGDQEEAQLLTSIVKEGVLVHSFVRDPMDFDQIVWR